MLQRLRIVLAEGKAGNTSENLLNEMRQIKYCLYQANEIAKKAVLKKSQCLLYMEKYKKSYQNNKFKIPAPIWNERFELPGGSYSRSDNQDYFEYLLKKHGEKTHQQKYT